ncbi:MAG: sigma-70 family RNA polymerase sigma factor [Planctomycetota bacterium]|nr:sigma-70 family RNA polymerase sigma factor [Planctomycetota bacterium]
MLPPDMNSPNPTTESTSDADHAVDRVADIDDGLMIRVQEGDSQAFPDLVERHQQSLINFFYANTRDRQLAEDLTQETLLKVFDQSWDYIPSGRFRGWMFRVARNLLIDTVRRRNHDALVKAVQGRTDETSVLAGLAEDVITAEDQADVNELASVVGKLLQTLPEEQRLTFTLHHQSELSLPEVARILQTSVATTKSRLRLAREKLREKLRGRGFEE